MVPWQRQSHTTLPAQLQVTRLWELLTPIQVEGDPILPPSRDHMPNQEPGHRSPEMHVPRVANWSAITAVVTRCELASARVTDATTAILMTTPRSTLAEERLYGSISRA